MSTATRSADDVARLLGQVYSPTPQQRAVIEAGAEPALVVAGAGSGKTETMAARVVWLIANGLVAPGEVLGLTFTRKAAGELAARIRGHIDRLRAAGAIPGGHDPLDAPTVSTYNSFANALFRENALAIGREADGVLLGEAAAWRLARMVVGRSEDPRLLETEHSLDKLTTAVLDLAHALSDNDVADPGAVLRLAGEFQDLLELPSGSTRSPSMAKAVEAVVLMRDLPLLVDLAVEYAAEKRRRGLIEYSDQVAFALQAVKRRGAGISEEYRSRFKVVLLDEYQDTSFIQTDLLAGLFARHPVMAVGDPNQSIYGWRGASADNLDDFSRAFAGSPGIAPTYPLTISWRNPTTVLDAANLIAAPLNAKARVDVERLDARADAPVGGVEVRFEQTVLDEAAAVAAWFRARFAATADEPQTAALLMRSWSRTDVFTRALRDAGIRYHVLGLGGLLEQPAVVDLVCALKVLVDPDAGSELLRLLAGARWRIGVRDLQALRGLAGWLERRDFRQQLLDGEVRQQLRGSVAEDEGASIVEALDFIGTARAEHGALADFSAAGLERLRSAAKQFDELRGRLGLDLLDLVTLVIQELNLDIEVRANESATGGQAGLDAFLGLARGFSASDDTGAGVRAFLDWLYEAEGRERFSPRTEAPEPGSVQVLTIHGSKGLEWDLVAVPRLVDDELPNSYRDGAGWVRFGKLPFDFRGDRGALPVLAWRSALTQKEFLANLEEFKGALRERHLDEERRLAYVAVTRARDRLLLSGSYWGGQTKPRLPSTYVTELREGGLIAADAVPDLDSDENPLDAELADPVLWPKNPLRGREAAVRAAADAVRARLELGPGDPARDSGPWRDELELLLRELRTRGGAEPAPPPVRIPASRYKDFVSDPVGTLQSLSRPMPERPYKATRIGTLFHAWVEQRAGVFGQTEVIDAAEFERDDLTPENEADADRLAELKATFERSEWASLKPVEVELEIHAPLAGHVFVCKLDAVYRLPGGRTQIVDWKTGKAPADDDDLERKQFQLALYRHAYATWTGADPESIDAVFYFVADDAVIRPERIYSSSELEERWLSTFSSIGASPSE
ncbi:ATP-dependent helicase [Gryllotalpicola protaetiae]|uniref:DNA 3'-5' helicase n=1 Tax=Gryllotalpicola protaetiae TaxID=2419771 RepID=A0A387BWE4_9MICO|nr:ATP-dependent helicase [Gryllotalpicola protaetiae]